MQKRNTGLSLLLAVAALACAPARAHAAVTKFEVVSRTPIAADTSRFGFVAPAEKIVARASLEVDPADARNKVIVDLDRAQRTAQGMVPFSADVVLLRPQRPNGLLIVEIPNRGESQVYSVLSDIAHPQGGGLDRAGNGFLLARGYTLAIVGWQGDLDRTTKIAASLPQAKGVEGFSRDEWVLPDASSKQRLQLSWPAVTSAPAQLLEHASENRPAETVSTSQWHFVDANHIEVASAHAGEHVVYELRYTAHDSAVMGLGFAAVRDVASFLEHSGERSNPLAQNGQPLIARSLLTGISQSGRVARDFLYWGFNCDQNGKPVFDGILPIIPGSRRSFTNARFGQPGRNPGVEADQLYPVDQFPFTYEVTKDSLSGKIDGLLQRCRETHTCPRILEYDSEYEFWGSRASLNVTDTKGHAMPLPENVRAYMLAGAPHSNSWNAISTSSARCAMPSSPVAFGPVIRALVNDLDEWIGGTAPPPSRYPSLTDGTLVPAAEVYAKSLPLPYHEQHLHALWVEQTSTGPVVRGEYPVLLPKADADGNAVAGIRLPQVAVPGATYVGWNPQTANTGPQDLCDHAAGMVRFQKTKAERIAAGDPRPSLEERYASAAEYESQLRRSAQQLVTARLLLKEDVDVVVKVAEDAVSR